MKTLGATSVGFRVVFVEKCLGLRCSCLGKLV